MKNFLLIILSFSIVSCTIKKIPQEESKPISTTKPIENKFDFYKKISTNSDFETLKINSKINAKTGNFIPTLDATIYLENDKKIWMNLSAIILQVARGMATQEGVKGYYKIDKTYIDSDFSYLNKLLNINFIDYKTLQNILLGKTFVPINENNFTLTQNANGFILKTKQNPNQSEENNINRDYEIELKYDQNFNLEQANLTNQNNGDQLSISYSNRVIFNNENLPKSVKIIIKADKTNEILIENTKFDFSKMETPYSVPANYSKTEIK